jgi:hypothetical protein
MHPRQLRLRLLVLALGLRAGAAPEIDAIHVDDESCSGLVHDNVTAQRISCAKFIAGLQNLTESAAAASARAGLPRRRRGSGDAGPGGVCPQGPQCTPPYCGCINITYQGVSRSVADHVIHFSDETVLMDYDRSPQRVYDRALPYLTTADRTHGAKQVRVGVAISGCIPTDADTTADAPPPPPCQAESWATRNESELAALMSAALPLLQRHPSFVGFSVFGPWGDHSKHSPAPSDTQWPHGTGSWYINHSMIVDPSPVTKNAWLSWAASRKVGEVYIAPDAGPVALVAVPVRSSPPPPLEQLSSSSSSSQSAQLCGLAAPSLDADARLPVCVCVCLALLVVA